MSTTDAPKLTKKQQKALAFRSGNKKGAKKAAQLAQDEVPADDLEEDAPQATSKPAKRKKEGESVASKDALSKEAKPEPGEEKAKSQPPKKVRLIVFVGNLAYDVTADQVAAHFEPCGEIPSVRLGTSKAAAEGAQQVKSKGYAFVEFKQASSLQNALRLHHSLIPPSKRKINVELTAGGGGKGEKRQAKIQANRKRLDTQREKRAEVAKESKKAKGDELVRHFRSDQPTELGDEGQAPKKVSRKKGALPKKKPDKPWLSGANNIKIG
ncbi:uncharacterized protein L969DRAFT_84378 [Mixia osmundae IAM 14324]|uniref:RRM domain-containing protein n=1 Tax=Mixia osmundae (strain CBS 9802 / IAM 14324 / JCM 22182 / KY 12970) TaxID=764103 RepID=G7E313_MIXOS|nr:uncharacterized protein L969DRAFT_84378 [Mixia osmundae IAM 14324]KEI42517.1 hypothetical protein L969DRAFT_84378 [Mixia osmundae IAM 14324]GAA97194.1 hypothetical protein E5Q_03870 [Mixia osmundae IAM 14324]